MPEVTFHGRLTMWRRMAGLRQEDAARAFGVPTDTYGDWERGRMLPNEGLWSEVLRISKIDTCPYRKAQLRRKSVTLRSRFKSELPKEMRPRRPTITASPECRVEFGFGEAETFADIVDARRALRRRHVVECKIIRVADNRLLDEWVVWQPGLDVAAEIAKRDAA